MAQACAKVEVLSFEPVGTTESQFTKKDAFVVTIADSVARYNTIVRGVTGIQS